MDRFTDGLRAHADVAISVLLVVAITYFVGEMLVAVIRGYTKRNPAILPSASVFSTLTRIVVTALGALIVLDRLGIAIAPLLTALGVGGLAVALALRDTLANLFAGLQLLASRQVRPGDYVRIEGSVDGRVVDIAWRTTTIRDHAGSTTIVPNEKLAGSTIIAWNGTGAIALGIPFAVPPKVDVDAVGHAVREAARQAGATGASFSVAAITEAAVTCAVRVTLEPTSDPYAVRDVVLATVARLVRASP